MGDRTIVTLTVFTAQKEEVIRLLDNEPAEDVNDATNTLSYLTYYEVNYGELKKLYHLMNNGIPFISRWEDGNDYSAGEKSCRFTPEGEMELKELYDCDENPNLGALLAVIDDPVALRNAVLHHAEVRKVLPWENQIEYGKLYRTKRLIGATGTKE